MASDPATGDGGKTAPGPSLDEIVLAVSRTGVVPVSRERARLETEENRWLVRRIVGQLVDPFQAWDRLTRHRTVGESIAAPDRLFHLRRGLHGATPRWVVRRMRQGSIRVALCASPGVPPAPCIRHPPSVDGAVRYCVVGAILARAEALALRAARSFDVIGGGTHALSLTVPGPRARCAVWTPVRSERAARTLRPALLLATKLLAELGDGRWWSDASGLWRPSGHYSEWSPPAAEVVGAAAWAEAVRRRLRVGPTDERPGSRLIVRRETVGAPYAELDDPFASLLCLRSLGIEPRGHSHEAVVLSLSPWAG